MATSRAKSPTDSSTSSWIHPAVGSGGSVVVEVVVVEVDVGAVVATVGVGGLLVVVSLAAVIVVVSASFSRAAASRGNDGKADQRDSELEFDGLTLPLGNRQASLTSGQDYLGFPPRPRSPGTTRDVRLSAGPLGIAPQGLTQTPLAPQCSQAR